VEINVYIAGGKGDIDDLMSRVSPQYQTGTCRSGSPSTTAVSARASRRRSRAPDRTGSNKPLGTVGLRQFNLDLREPAPPAASRRWRRPIEGRPSG